MAQEKKMYIQYREKTCKANVAKTLIGELVKGIKEVLVISCKSSLSLKKEKNEARVKEFLYVSGL